MQIHRYSWKLPFPWPQGNTASFYQLPTVSAKTPSPSPALPCAPAEHLFRATCHCSVHTDEWREYCWDFAGKWAQISAAVATRSTKVLLSNLTFPGPWESRIKTLLWKATTIDIIVIWQWDLMSKEKNGEREEKAAQRNKVLIDPPLQPGFRC